MENVFIGLSCNQRVLLTKPEQKLQNRILCSYSVLQSSYSTRSNKLVNLNTGVSRYHTGPQMKRENAFVFLKYEGNTFLEKILKSLVQKMTEQRAIS